MSVETPRRTEPNIPVAAEEITIPGLRPEAGNLEKGTLRKSNIDELMPQIAQTLGTREWFGKLAQDVLENKKSAIFIIGVGTIGVIAALGAGYEFGRRDGRDIRHLIEGINKFRPKPPQE